MKITTIRLDDDQAEQLEVIAQIEGCSVSEAVRMAVGDWVEAKRKNRPFRDRAEQLLQRRDDVLRHLAKPPQTTHSTRNGRQRTADTRST